METHNETFTTEGKTDGIGKYTLKVEGDHENDICEVTLVNSPKDDCKEVVPDMVNNRVICSKNVGMHNAVRFVNPLFYQKDKPIDGCAKLVEEMELVDLLILENDKEEN